MIKILPTCIAFITVLFIACSSPKKEDTTVIPEPITTIDETERGKANADEVTGVDAANRAGTILEEVSNEDVPIVTEHANFDDEIELDENMFYTGREFMIVLSTTNFEKAQERAIEAAQKLNIELKIDDVELVDGHLSFSDTTCEGSGWDYPCYVARGRWDEGNFVSIEQSDAYDGFTKGYFIVIVSSGEKGDQKRREYLNEVHKHYDDAYIKSTQVYMGCMH